MPAGRPSNKNYDKFSIFYSDGELKSGNKLVKQIKAEFEEEKISYEYKEGKEIFYVPQETADYIRRSKSGGLLSDTRCIHCRKKIIMLFSSIRNEELSTCPKCNRNIYCKTDKKVRKRIW